MKIGKACAVFMQIDSDKYTVEEKGPAIFEVLKMPTHNGVTKDAMLRVIKFLLYLAYDVPDAPERDEESEGTWIIDECDSTDETPSYSYIDFRCSKCNTNFGLEEGQYDWCGGEEIPYKYCPICGTKMKASGGEKE